MSDKVDVEDRSSDQFLADLNRFKRETEDQFARGEVTEEYRIAAIKQTDRIIAMHREMLKHHKPGAVNVVTGGDNPRISRLYRDALSAEDDTLSALNLIVMPDKEDEPS